MNRKIKFRCWIKSEERFVYNPVIDFTNMIVYSEMNPVNNSGGFIIYDGDFILCQYTGLDDKNGKEIYEGDILKFSFGVGKVVFCDGGFACDMWEKDKPAHLFHWFNFCNIDHSHIIPEVIGNIYENPEFLEEIEK